jgi:small acid-soluble spore protein F (minor alpha/beta-type SASP)
MNENLKVEIAKELGVFNKVQEYGWGEVSSKNCGSMVRKAIEIANRAASEV